MPGGTDVSLFARAGGEPVVRTIISVFVDLMYEDPMIGFFFSGVDKERLKTREYEFTAQFLGANVAYTGRSLQETHARHRIMGGQFDRRKQLLENVLVKYDVPSTIRKDWLAHVESLRDKVTRDEPGECDDRRSE